jgi:hypothetical protein
MPACVGTGQHHHEPRLQTKAHHLGIVQGKQAATRRAKATPAGALSFDRGTALAPPDGKLALHQIYECHARTRRRSVDLSTKLLAPVAVRATAPCSCGLCPLRGARGTLRTSCGEKRKEERNPDRSSADSFAHPPPLFSGHLWYARRAIFSFSNQTTS